MHKSSNTAWHTLSCMAYLDLFHTRRGTCDLSLYRLIPVALCRCFTFCCCINSVLYQNRGLYLRGIYIVGEHKCRRGDRNPQVRQADPRQACRLRDISPEFFDVEDIVFCLRIFCIHISTLLPDNNRLLCGNTARKKHGTETGTRTVKRAITSRSKGTILLLWCAKQKNRTLACREKNKFVKTETVFHY